MALTTENGQATSRQFDVRLLTKQPEYAVPSTVYNLDGQHGSENLNNLVNELLRSNRSPDDEEQPWTDVGFDFLLNGQLLRLSIQEHLEEQAKNRGDQAIVATGEKELEIEYIIKERAPKPSNSLQHDDWVSSVDTNDKYILSGSYDGFVHIWTLAGKHKVAIPGSSSPIKVARWIDTRKIPAEAAIPPFGDNEYGFITGSHDEAVHVWKWNSKSNQVDCVFVCRGHCRSVDCVDVNCDLFASGSFDRLLKIWSLEVDNEDTGEENGQDQKNKKKHKGRDGGSTSTDGTPIANWNKTKVPLLTLSGHNEAITDLKWLSNKESSSAAPELATCSMDNTIRLWDIEVSEAKQTLVGSKAFLALSYSFSNNLLLTGGTDRHVRAWDPRCAESSMVRQTFSSHEAWVSSVAWSPSSASHFITGSYDNCVKHWDFRSPKVPLFDLLGHKDKVLCVDWTNPSYIISGAADNQVKTFSAQ